MKIRSSAIFLFFLFASVISCWDLEDAAAKLDHLQDIKFLRFPRDSDDESSIWLDYEFNTGAGNREGDYYFIKVVGKFCRSVGSRFIVTEKLSKIWKTIWLML